MIKLSRNNIKKRKVSFLLPKVSFVNNNNFNTETGLSSNKRLYNLSSGLNTFAFGSPLAGNILNQSIISTLNIKNKNIQIKYIIFKLSQMIKDIDNLILYKHRLLKNIKLNKMVEIILPNYNNILSLNNNSELSNNNNNNIQIKNMFNSTSLLSNELNTFKINNNNNLINNSELNNSTVLLDIFNNNNNFLANKESEISFKENKIKIEETMKTIIKDHTVSSLKELLKDNNNILTNNTKTNTHFNIVNNNSITSPVSITLTKDSNNKIIPNITQYLTSMSNYNLMRKGTLMNFSKFIGYQFNKLNNKLVRNPYDLLNSTFKSMYCLISRPVFLIKTDKIIIQLFYYLLIPKLLKNKKLKSNIINTHQVKKNKDRKQFFTYTNKKNNLNSDLLAFNGKDNNVNLIVNNNNINKNKVKLRSPNRLIVYKNGHMHQFFANKRYYRNKFQ